MAYEVWLILEDGTRREIAEFGEFAHAAGVAIRLADETGKQFVDRPSEMPSKVNVYFRGQTEISIVIIQGGLLASEGSPRLRSI